MKIARCRVKNTLAYCTLWRHSMVSWKAIGESCGSGPERSGIENALAAPALTRDVINDLVPFLDRWLREHEAEALKLSFPIPNALEPPVSPQNILCVGLNYRDHASESKMEIPAHPLLFAKATNALCGAGCPVLLPPGSTQTDYEAELAVVIGRACHRVPAAQALDYVAGYTCANDVSARDFQFADGQWFRGKSADTFCPLGPWMVTPDEIPDPGNLDIRLRLNGRTLQDSNTRHLIFGIPELIEYISATITLQPGDIICTGTPPGVGFARKPPIYLQPEDQMEVEIDSIGILKNNVSSRTA